VPHWTAAFDFPQELSIFGNSLVPSLITEDEPTTQSELLKSCARKWQQWNP